MNHPKQKSEKKIDEAVAESFPASDPPSYMGSTAVAGGPEGDDPKFAEPDNDRVVTERVSIDLNKASKEEISALPALGPSLVQILLDRRPFASWEDLKGLPGFDGEKIAALKKGGAHI
jgi:DNA uptake protein ComE-like DNA-binding protein